MSASSVLKLQKVGFTVDQVEALAEFMDTQAASKADLMEVKAELKADIAVLKADVALLKADVAVLKTDVAALKADVAALKTDMTSVKADIVLIRRDMSTLEERLTLKLTIRIGAMLFAGFGVTLAAMGLFVRFMGHG